jgi:hypothetical protein
MKNAGMQGGGTNPAETAPHASGTTKDSKDAKMKHKGEGL